MTDQANATPQQNETDAARIRHERASAIAMRRKWKRVVDTLDAIVADPPEPGSVLAQLTLRHAVPDLAEMLRLVATQGTQFLRASISVAPIHGSGVEFSPVGPLARSALLAFSKIVSITAPLGWEVRGIGPALQHHHDGLVDMVLEQDTHALLEPSSPGSVIWVQRGRPGMINRLSGLREMLGARALTAKGPSPSDKLVTETSWIAEAQARCIELQHLEGVTSDQFTNRMRWAWQRGSIVAHAGFATEATPTALALVYLSAEDSSALIRFATELAAAAQRVLGEVWFAEGAPPSFTYNADYRLDKSAPHL